ncbi:MAG: TrmH family RNA methyltransferase [Pirellula sp.]
MALVQRLQSLSNPQLKRLKRLHRVSQSQSEFLIEGTHLVTEALSAGWPLIAIFYTENWASDNRSLLQRVPDPTEQYSVDTRWLSQAATTQHPEGVVAIGSLETLHGTNGLSYSSLDKLNTSLVLAADGVQDPGNAGTLLRSVVALGADRMYLSPDSVSPVHPKFLRSTAGQWFRSPPQVASIQALAADAKRVGIRVVVADVQGESIESMDLRIPTMFIVGSEGQGVGGRTRELADAICTIPMARQVESLNVAIAGTILLYEAHRQRRQRAAH